MAPQMRRSESQVARAKSPCIRRLASPYGTVIYIFIAFLLLYSLFCCAWLTSLRKNYFRGLWGPGYSYLTHSLHGAFVYCAQTQ